MDLQEYDFVIQHILGKTNTTADALSRPPSADTGETDNKDITVLKTEIFIKATKTTIPSEMQKCSIMNQVHDHPTVGHPR